MRKTNIFKPFKATAAQLNALDNLKKNYCIPLVRDEYGFYSNGSIGVTCEDGYGLFKVVIDRDGGFM